jgi:hypothetical protein
VAGGIISNPMTPSGIESATFQLVVQCLNQLCVAIGRYKLGLIGTHHLFALCLLYFVLVSDKHTTHGDTVTVSGVLASCEIALKNHAEG